MPKKENSENLEGSKFLEVDQIIDPSDEFDLSVLKSDFENAEKEAKETIQENMIEKADFQKDAENLQDEKEMIDDFKEMVIEILEMVFAPINRSFRKKDIDKLDNKFIEKFTDKLIRIIPKDKIDKMEAFIGISDKASKAKTYLRIVRFITFVFKEVFTRFDQYELYRETHETGKTKKLIDKTK